MGIFSNIVSNNTMTVEAGDDKYLYGPPMGETAAGGIGNNLTHANMLAGDNIYADGYGSGQVAWWAQNSHGRK